MCILQARRRRGVQGSTTAKQPQSQHGLGGGGGGHDNDSPQPPNFLVASCTLTTSPGVCWARGMFWKRCRSRSRSWDTPAFPPVPPPAPDLEKGQLVPIPGAGPARVGVWGSTESCPSSVSPPPPKHPGTRPQPQPGGTPSPREGAPRTARARPPAPWDPTPGTDPQPPGGGRCPSPGKMPPPPPPPASRAPASRHAGLCPPSPPSR